MQTRELSSTDWAHFFDEFSRDHHGWLATVEREHRGHRVPEVVRRPLVAITTEPAGPRERTVVITLHPTDDPQNTIRLEHAAAVRVHETDEGLPQHVEVESDTGEHVMLRLRGVLSPDTLLDGLAPGELP